MAVAFGSNITLLLLLLMLLLLLTPGGGPVVPPPPVACLGAGGTPTRVEPELPTLPVELEYIMLTELRLSYFW